MICWAGASLDLFILIGLPGLSGYLDVVQLFSGDDSSGRRRHGRAIFQVGCAFSISEPPFFARLFHVIDLKKHLREGCK